MTMTMRDDVRDALIDLIALERDRELGYPKNELHMRPEQAIENGLTVIDQHSDMHVEDIVEPDEARLLGLYVDTDTDQEADQ
jgi:hypothetical protein